MFQHVPGSLPAKSQQMYSSQLSQQSQYHTPANAFLSHQELNNWTKVTYKRARSTQDETERETKRTKESVHGLNQSSTSNRYTALLEEESEEQQHKTGPNNMPKPPPIYITQLLKYLTTHTAVRANSKTAI
jgi:hypothetical protein